MNLTLEDIRYLRLYKQGLIEKFNSFDMLIKKLDFQAQSEKDLVFNIKQRLINKDFTLDEAIRIWYVRNTLYLLNKDKYETVVNVNRFIDNWFHKKYLKNKKDINDYNYIKNIVVHNEYVYVSQLLSMNCNIGFIKNWGGVFIELTKEGIICNKSGNEIRVNRQKLKNYNIDFLKYIIEDYFKIYGPATLKDFKYWFGSNDRLIDEVFNYITTDIIPINNNMFVYYNDLKFLDQKKKIDPIVLSKFDNICLSYRDKTWLIEENHFKKIWNKCGIVESIILVNGCIAATWRQDKKIIRIKKFKKIDKCDELYINNIFKSYFNKPIVYEVIQ